MFDNLPTALLQAVGFFGIFGFFVYQLLSDGQQTIKSQSNSPRKKVKEFKESKNIPEKKGLFGRKIQPIKEEVKTKKGLFSSKTDPIKDQKTKKKGWFK